jgi:hypothetical protein
MRPPYHTWRALAVAAGLAWLSAAAFGFWTLHAYEATPGPIMRSPDGWPPGSTLSRSRGRADVLMAVHPRCPCTRASLAILAEIVREAPGAATVRLLAYRPKGSTPDWGSEGIRWALDTVPGAVVVDDPGGVEALKFGLGTSGAVVAFDAPGRERFSGGLTAGRGVAERSAGGASLGEVLANRGPTRADCQTYGCPLVSGPRGSLSQGDRP